MGRLKVFEGIPPPYDRKKRMVVPQAIRVLRLKPGRKYCTVGRLGHEFGWKYQDVVARYVFVDISTSTSLTVPGSRRGERSTVPHTTSARRLPEGSWPMPRRPPRSTTRSRSSSPSTDTRFGTQVACTVEYHDCGRTARDALVSWDLSNLSYNSALVEWVSPVKRALRSLTSIWVSFLRDGRSTLSITYQSWLEG